MTPPTASTLRRYGLTATEWLAMLKFQGGVCALCRKVPKSGRFVVDHHHVKGWKGMTPELRKKFCRGILCAHCNHRLVGQFMTLEAARAVVLYLERYEVRRCQPGEMFA